ncbi:hypothetical protein ABPG75_002038 [Micractinium tetrahymenae]
MYTVALLVGSFVLWIASEKTLLHFSRTARRLFWYLLACAIGVVLVRWLQSIEGVGMMWVFLSAIMAASMIEDEVVKTKGLTLLDIESTSRLRARLRTPEAQGKAERLMDIVSTISHGRGATLGARQLWARMSGTMRRLRRIMHALLQQAEADELNYILCTINAPAMVEVCSRSTMDLLTRERLPELATETRSVLIDALQKIGMRYRPLRQAWAANVLLATRGLELTLLKNYLDDGGDYHTCYKLVYNDLQGALQQQVMEHLTAEGAAVMADFMRLAPGGPPGVVLKLLSDVDDTVFSSGGSFPAGSDTRYPKKCYYPGALALYAELDRSFAKRYGAVLQRLRDSERRQAHGLPPLPPLPAAQPGQLQQGQGQGPATGYASPEAELGGGSPRAALGGGWPLLDSGSGEDGEAQRTPPAAALRSEPTFSLAPHRQPSGDSAREADDVVAAAAAGAAAAGVAAAADAGGKGRQEEAVGAGEGSSGASRPSQPIPVPRDQGASLRHSVSGPAAYSLSMGRPPRSPRPATRRPPPPHAPAAAAGPLSPASFRSLPQGDPLSPSGASPTSSGVLGPPDEASSLAGSTWGPSSLATGRGAGSGSGSVELADTLTSRLRPLLVPHGGGGSAGVSSARLGGLGRPSGSLGVRGGAPGDAGWRAEQAAREREPHQEGSNLVFLSARPESYKGMTEAEAYRKYFQPFVVRGELDTSPTMLLGAMTSGPKALLQWLGVVTWFPALAPPEDPKTAVAALYQQLAAKKLSRFREYAAIFPEACFLLVGDNGQGDLLCAEILWSSMRQNLPPGARSRLLGCFLHKVVSTRGTYSMLRSSKTSKAGWHVEWRQRGIHFAKSHVGMATQAYHDGLVDLEALHRVCIAAAADFRRVWARYGGRHAGRNLGKALKHLNTDLRAANYVLPPRLQVPPLCIPGLAEGESLRGSRLPPPSPARSEALSDLSAFGQAVLH